MAIVLQSADLWAATWSSGVGLQKALLRFPGVKTYTDTAYSEGNKV